MKSKIVLITDSSDTKDQISSMLTEDSYELLVENSGQKALELFDGKEIDLVIMDYALPGMSGVEFTRKIKEVPPYEELPVIVVYKTDDLRDKNVLHDKNVAHWINYETAFGKIPEIANYLLSG